MDRWMEDLTVLYAHETSECTRPAWLTSYCFLIQSLTYLAPGQGEGKEAQAFIHGCLLHS